MNTIYDYDLSRIMVRTYKVHASCRRAQIDE